MVWVSENFFQKKCQFRFQKIYSRKKVSVSVKILVSPHSEEYVPSFASKTTILACILISGKDQNILTGKQPQNCVQCAKIAAELTTDFFITFDSSRPTKPRKMIPNLSIQQCRLFYNQGSLAGLDIKTRTKFKKLEKKRTILGENNRSIILPRRQAGK